MSAPMTPERLAEIREKAHGWRLLPPAIVELTFELLDEIDRQRREIVRLREEIAMDAEVYRMTLGQLKRKE